MSTTIPSSLETATLASGCFWCSEAIFQRLKGVESVMSGYTGGNKDNPSYEQVSSEKTGHAEAINITFDPSIIPYEKILEVFWKTHDPTTMNQQGADMGTQYRSAIFYHSEAQQKTAETSKETAQAMFDDPIVTEIVPFTNFYEAEIDHQNFYKNNPEYGYCKLVIDPKITKLMKNFKEDIKPEYGAAK